jgi:hypothetical protein
LIEEAISRKMVTSGESGVRTSAGHRQWNVATNTMTNEGTR